MCFFPLTQVVPHSESMFSSNHFGANCRSKKTQPILTMDSFCLRWPPTLYDGLGKSYIYAYVWFFFQPLKSKKGCFKERTLWVWLISPSSSFGFLSQKPHHVETQTTRIIAQTAFFGPRFNRETQVNNFSLFRFFFPFKIPKRFLRTTVPPGGGKRVHICWNRQPPEASEILSGSAQVSRKPSTESLASWFRNWIGVGWLRLVGWLVGWDCWGWWVWLGFLKEVKENITPKRWWFGSWNFGGD